MLQPMSSGRKTPGALWRPLSVKRSRPRGPVATDDNPALQAIWHVVCAIPRGQVSTYGAVARAAGLPGRARQAGFALIQLAYSVAIDRAKTEEGLFLVNLAEAMVNYLALLSAHQAYQQALVTRVQAQANRLTDTAALFQALGGGWWNREDVAPAKKWDIELIP